MNEVQGRIIDDTLFIFLSGRLDSGNAASVEKEIDGLISDGCFQHVVMDVEKLEYISSAGLRTILHLRKRFADLKITNVSSDVYDIFDMTGFTQMMTVERAFRRISVDGCEVIDSGSNGILYRIDEDTVVKVFKSQNALSDIRREQELARTALVLGIPTAISYDVVRVGDGYGAVFELLNSRSFAKILSSEPDKMQWCVDEYTRLLNQIHATVVPAGKFPDMLDTVREWTAFMKDYLPVEAYEKLSRLVLAVPHDDHMIHGDYHVKNLQLQGDEVLLIDMDTLAVGHPVFELASIYNAYIGFHEYQEDPNGPFLGISQETAVEFWNRFLKKYLGTENEQKIREVEDKARVIGYVRLIRRSIRRHGLEDAVRKAEIDLWTSRLLELLKSVDTLLFHKNEIQVKAGEEKLEDVLGFIDGFLKEAGCDPKTTKMVEMAVEEIFINIVSYAYGTLDGTVKITGEVTEQEARKCVTFTFADSGVPFNPLSREDPDIHAPAENREIGGLGIFLVKKVMDEVLYENRDGLNILTVRKYITA